MIRDESTRESLFNNQTDQGGESRDNICNAMRNECNSQIFQFPQRGKTICDDFKQFIFDIYRNYKITITVIANALIVLLLTLSFSKMFASNCKAEGDLPLSDEEKVYCEPFYALDSIVVDIDLNTSTHCYSSRSCVALGKTLKNQQGKFRYNFIIGTYGFVYVEHGYKCQTEERDDALYIRLPVDSIYNGQDFMAAHKTVSKFNEILREGLECGKILHNYTITTMGCGKFNEWCTHTLQELVSEEPSGGISEPRYVYDDETQEASFFNPLNIKRVYNYQYKLLVCNQNHR